MTKQNLKKEPQDWSTKLVEACAEFVKFKDDIDSANRTAYVHSGFIRKLRWIAGLYEPSIKNGFRLPSAAMPSDFVLAALPFIYTLKDNSAEYERCLIHPQLVVSGTFNTYNIKSYGGYTDSYPDEVMKWSNEGVIGAEKLMSSSNPQYHRPGILPLYIAIEGKNRVELFKRHRAAMYAWVLQTESVQVSELKLVCLKPFNTWAISYRNQLRILPFSEHTLPIYKALGVEEGTPRWDFFALKKLRQRRIKALKFQMRN